MKVASDSSPSHPLLTGPAAAVAVALVGAALVAIGLLLLGVRDSQVGLWMPVPPAVSQVTAS